MENVEPKIESQEKLRDATLVFLVKKSENHISEVCLAMKKRGFGNGRWNGAGGKVEAGEAVTEAAARETREEIGVEIGSVKKVAELSFYFPHQPAWNQKVHVYLSETWSGDPVESEEMKPQWFQTEDLPFDSMWSADRMWIPEILSGKLIKAKVMFGENDIVESYQAEDVTSF